MKIISDLSFRTQVRTFYVAFGIWIVSIVVCWLHGRTHFGGGEPSESDIGLPMYFGGYFEFAPLLLALLGVHYLIRCRGERRTSPFAFYSGLAAAFLPLLGLITFFIVMVYG